MDGCAVLPAIGTRGGATILWNKQLMDLATHAVGVFSITAKVSVIQSNYSFWLTTVYGPVDDTLKDSFLPELVHAPPPPGQPWLISGDFNIIYEARTITVHVTSFISFEVDRSSVDWSIVDF